MDLNRETISKIRGLIILTIVLLVGLWRFDIVWGSINFIFNIIFPFIVGAALAFILNVPMSFVERHLFKKNKFKRSFSLIITLVIVLCVIAFVMLSVIPQLGATFLLLGRNIQAFMPKVQSWLEELFKNNETIVTWINGIQFNWEKIIQSIIDFFKAGAGNVLNVSFAAAKSIISGMTTFIIAFVFSCYILLQKERLTVQVKKICYAFLPQKVVEKILSVATLTNKTFSGFLTGQCLEAMILGSMFFVTMSIIRLPYALLVGILIAFTALIPIVGSFIGCVIGVFLIFMVSPIKALIFLILFLVLQQIEGNLIYPRVVGGSIGLPSIWVLVAVSVGASLMGIVGMLLFIPLTSVLYSLFRGYVYARLEKKNIKVE